jgi:hypothetical protein
VKFAKQTTLQWPDFAKTMLLLLLNQFSIATRRYFEMLQNEALVGFKGLIVLQDLM